VASFSSRFPNDVDICDLAKGMRQADIDELDTVCEYPPDEAIIRSMQASSIAFLQAYHDADGQLICICGCSPQLDGSATPWMLSTDLLDRYSKSLTQIARSETKRMLATYQTLSNAVDVRNVKTIQWLKAIGFEMKETLELKPGLPVLRFEMRA
jgi:hypothetical protein